MQKISSCVFWFFGKAIWHSLNLEHLYIFSTKAVEVDDLSPVDIYTPRLPLHFLYLPWSCLLWVISRSIQPKPTLDAVPANFFNMLVYNHVTKRCLYKHAHDAFEFRLHRPIKPKGFKTHVLWPSSGPTCGESLAKGLIIKSVECIFI